MPLTYLLTYLLKYESRSYDWRGDELLEVITSVS